MTLQDVTITKSGSYAISARDGSVVTCEGGGVSFSEITGDGDMLTDDEFYSRGGGIFMCVGP